MRRFAVTIATATVFVASASIMGASVGAAPMVAPGSIRGMADSLNVVERAQFIWLGHNYCWYDDGWNGPGWYWCGQYLTSGIGWGGGYGWHHWHGGHPRAYYHGAKESHGARVSHGANVSHGARVSHGANVSRGANVSHGARVSHGGGGGGGKGGGGGGGGKGGGGKGGGGKGGGKH
jgi:hypothetical protein